MSLKFPRIAMLASAAAVAVLGTFSVAQAEIDGHGPDAWRVADVASNDKLNARSGPGTNYDIIDTFAHDERRMTLVTCVPYLPPAYFSTLTQAQIDALPQRWCLMRSEDFVKAGWVSQRFITPE